MWFYNGKAESPKGRHSKCVDCFAIKFRRIEDGLRQTQGAQKNGSQWGVCELRRTG
jgi:hypothetical protein